MDNELLKNLINLGAFHGIIAAIAWISLGMMQRKNTGAFNWLSVLPFAGIYFIAAMIINSVIASTGLRAEFARIIAMAGGHLAMYSLYSRSVRNQKS